MLRHCLSQHAPHLADLAGPSSPHPTTTQNLRQAPAKINLPFVVYGVVQESPKARKGKGAAGNASYCRLALRFYVLWCQMCKEALFLA